MQDLEEANERKAEAKSVIESQKETARQMRNKFFQIDEKCTQEVAHAKRSAQQFVDNIIAIIEAKKQEIFYEIENEGKQSLQRLGTQKGEIEQQAQMIEAGTEKTESLLKRNTKSEIAQLDKTLKTIFQEEGGREGEQVDYDLEQKAFVNLIL